MRRHIHIKVSLKNEFANRSGLLMAQLPFRDAGTIPSSSSFLNNASFNLSLLAGLQDSTRLSYLPLRQVSHCHLRCLELALQIAHLAIRAKLDRCDFPVHAPCWRGLVRRL